MVETGRVHESPTTIRVSCTRPASTTPMAAKPAIASEPIGVSSSRASRPAFIPREVLLRAFFVPSCLRVFVFSCFRGFAVSWFRGFVVSRLALRRRSLASALRDALDLFHDAQNVAAENVLHVGFRVAL